MAGGKGMKVAGLLLISAAVIAGRLLRGPLRPVADRSASTATDAWIRDCPVMRVSDGDTLVVSLHGRDVKVRLSGIDCPESDQEFGPEAKRALENTLSGDRVSLKTEGEDQYGRLLAQAFAPDGTLVNLRLVETGFAWVRRDFTNDPELIAAEARARAEGLGLWSKPDPESPWDFKRRQREQGH